MTDRIELTDDERELLEAYRNATDRAREEATANLEDQSRGGVAG